MRAASLSVLKLIESTPTLLAAHLRYFHNHGETIILVLAEREGADPVADPRPWPRHGAWYQRRWPGARNVPGTPGR